MISFFLVPTLFSSPHLIFSDRRIDDLQDLSVAALDSIDSRLNLTAAEYKQCLDAIGDGSTSFAKTIVKKAALILIKEILFALLPSGFIFRISFPFLSYLPWTFFLLIHISQAILSEDPEDKPTRLESNR